MRLLSAISCLLLVCSLQAQVSFRTVVPQQPVVEGEAFQVQYVLTGAERINVIRTPVFAGFRLISGPNIYAGSSANAFEKLTVQNFTYTLEAVKPGKYLIPAAMVAYNGKPLESNEIMLRVISREEAAADPDRKDDLPGSAYYLKPGEDPYKKIRENLFVQMQVDKRSCRVGEPVLATFKLYSRLESKSDIIKNPGFYGFTVYDMAGLADKLVATEKWNGRLFDVHTIRKVQLYPLQAGRFTIDAMEVINKVEFSRSFINRKTEQQIAEGILGTGTDEPVPDGTDVYETRMSTAPVEVEVRPLPEKSKPALFSGAVGRFSIRSVMPDVGLAKNEEGFLEVTISGQGNFTQLDAPVIQWPAGIEGFEPTVEDNLDKTRLPLQGSRVFRFPFVCAAPGTYTLPAISFAYFDTDSNGYKTICTDPVSVKAGDEVKKEPVKEEKKSSFAEQNERAARTAGIIAMAMVLLILLYWIFARKEKTSAAVPVIHKPVMAAATDLLKPARESAGTDDRSFYTALQSAVWSFAAQRFDLSGSAMNKQGLAAMMNESLGDPDLSQRLIQVLETCEAGLFTQARLGEDRVALLQQVTEILEKIDRSLGTGLH